MAGVGSSLHRKKMYVLESYTVSRESAVNLSRGIALPACDLRVCTLLYACLSTRTPIHRPIQAHTLYQRETLLSCVLDSAPSSGMSTKLLESLGRPRLIGVLRTHRTHGYCCRGTTLLALGLVLSGSYPGLLLPSSIM